MAITAQMIFVFLFRGGRERGDREYFGDDKVGVAERNFVEMARWWCGVQDEDPQAETPL